MSQPVIRFARMSFRRLIVVLAALWALPARAADPGVIEAKGEATIVSGDLVTAKKAAVADALRHAVEQIIGFTVTNSFSADQQEVVKNDKSRFESAVHDNIVQKSEGYVESYDVTSESHDATTERVTVRARIVQSKLQAELDATTKLLAKAGNPRVAVVVSETHAGKVMTGSTLGSAIEQGLAERGFIVLAPDVTARIAKGVKAGQKGDMSDDPTKLAQAAMDAGADIVIAGHVDVIDQGVIKDGDFEALKGQHKIEIDAVIRGIQVTTAEVTSATPIKTTSIGLDVERAVQRAFMGRGNNIVTQTLDELVPGLKAALQKTADSGKRYVIQVKGISSYRNQGAVLVSGLQSATGVSGATQRSFDGGLLVIDVACACSLADLQSRIFDIAKQNSALGALDLSRIAGSQLEFHL